MVPPASHRVSRVPWYSGSYLKNYRFNYVAITLYSGAFQLSSSTMTSSLMTCPQPQRSKLHWFGLFRFRSPLLTESISLSFPPLTEMFHFSGFRVSYPMYSGMNDRVLPRSGYPIRISPDHRLLAASRGFSQLAASFFACWHQGIHRTPLLTSSYCKSCYHFHNTTKPFRDLLYCLIAWYACLSCVL